MGTKILGIDIGSTQICAVMVEHEPRSLENTIKVIGMGTVKSQGLKKGSITNIELASNSIKSVVSSVVRTAGIKFDKVIVSISGKDAKNILTEISKRLKTNKIVGVSVGGTVSTRNNEPIRDENGKFTGNKKR